MGHPLGPGRPGSGVGGVTDQAIKPTMAARITPATKRGALRKDILRIPVRPREGVSIPLYTRFHPNKKSPRSAN